jgi:hypothetical protein
MYGTPWHGDANFGSSRAVRLKSIFFLRHGKENEITEIRGIDPVSQLLTCSFPTLWDHNGMAFSMELFADLTTHVPCRELVFTPDRGAIDLVEEVVT